MTIDMPARGERQSGRRSLSLAVTAFVVLLVVGTAYSFSPVSTVILLVGLGCAIVLARHLTWALVVLALVQVVCPLYLAVPIVPVLPPFPASLLVVIGVTALVVLRAEPVARGRVHPVTWALLAYGFAFLISVLFSVAPLSTFNGVIRCCGIPFAAYAVTRRLVRTPRDALLPLDALLLGCVLISLYGAVEFALGWNPLIENLSAPTGERGDLLYWNQRESTGFIYRSFSVEMNPLYFAASVSMMFPYALARFGQASSQREKVVFAAAAVACVLGVATTFSRGPLMSMVIAALGIAILFPGARRLVGATLLAGVGGIAAMLPFLGSEISQRFSDPDNVAMRFKLWQVCWAMFVQHPFTGVGLDGFTFHQADVIRAAEIGPFPEHSIGELETIGTADGTLPQLAAEVGILGLGSALALLGTATAAARRCFLSPDATTRLVAVSVAMGALAYGINGATITIYTAYTPTVLLGILFGLVASLDVSTRMEAKP